MREPCECEICCEGEHAGYCRECAGWGEFEGETCPYCGGDGECPACGGNYLPEVEDEMDDQDAEATGEPTAGVDRRLSDMFRQLGRPNWLAVQIPDGLVVAGPPVIPIPEPLTAAEQMVRLKPWVSDAEIVRALVATAPKEEPPRCGYCATELSGDYPNCMTKRESGEEFCSPVCRSEWENAQDAPARADVAEQRIADLEAENERLRERLERMEDLRDVE